MYYKRTSLPNRPSIARPRNMWEMWRLLSRIQRFSGCNTMIFLRGKGTQFMMICVVCWVMYPRNLRSCSGLQSFGISSTSWWKILSLYIYIYSALCIMYTLFIIVHIMVHTMVCVMLVPIHPDAAQNPIVLSNGWKSTCFLYLILPSRGKLCPYSWLMNTWSKLVIYLVLKDFAFFRI